MKRYLENFIEDLPIKSGYSWNQLMDMFNSYVNECYEDGERVNLAFFAGVTMEHDW